jgi:hypothetical protein
MAERSQLLSEEIGTVHTGRSLSRGEAGQLRNLIVSRSSTKAVLRATPGWILVSTSDF